MLFLGIYLLVLGWRGVRDSIAFRSTDRINIVLYGVEPVLISLGLTDKVNYLARFDNSMKTYAPGGYGVYGIGGLSKLGSLEDDPDLLRRTFSLMVSADVDYYLYPRQTQVYQTSDFTKGFLPTKTALINALFSGDVVTNARFLDKIFLFLTIGKQRKIDYVSLKTNLVNQSKNGDVFASDDFFKNYQGFFYKKTLREIDSTIQIQYSTSYAAAKNIGRILDGEGVRVSDIDIVETVPSKCLIKFKNEQTSVVHAKTEVAIRKLLAFPCTTQKGSVGNRSGSDSFDMVIVLHPKLESLWK